MTESPEAGPSSPKSLSPAANLLRKEWLIPGVSAGLVSGIITVAYTTSFAVLVYGDLGSSGAKGIGFALLGSTLMGLIVALTSSYPGIVASSQDVPAAVLSLIAAGIVSRMTGTSTADGLFVTILAAVVFSSLLTGLFFISLGQFKLGDLVRFLPYPVLGGYLAGTGWLLVSGGIRLMAGVPLTFTELDTLFQADIIARWLPGAIFALVLLLGLRRGERYWIMPVIGVAAMVLFYIALWVTDTPVDLVSQRGWLMGPFPAGKLWQPVALTQLREIDWAALLGQTGNIVTMLLVSVVALLLNATGLELMVGDDIDLNRELRAAGLGNLGAGLGGSIAGYHSYSRSAFCLKMGASNRLAGLVSAGFVGATLIFGASVLALVPRLLLGGLVLYMGIHMLAEWVFQAWFKFGRIDHLIILAILVVIALVGFLEGVALGVVLSVVLFVINYSRVDVVKRAISGRNYQSRVTRNLRHRQLLEQRGDEIFVLQLQGFIFFGTANRLLEQVRHRVTADSLPRTRFVLLDFRQVTGLDSTAILSFSKMLHLAQRRQFIVAFAGQSAEGALPGHGDSVTRFFSQMRATEEAERTDCIRIFPDLDRGLEWCENQILAAAGEGQSQGRESLRSQLAALLPDLDTLETLLRYFERVDLEAGERLIRQGESASELYFIESGQVTAQLEYGDREPVRLETMQGGHVVGEIGFFLNRSRTAAVIADRATTAYRLTKQALERMEVDEPQAAFAFHQGIIRLISDRLSHLISSVEALQ